MRCKVHGEDAIALNMPAADRGIKPLMLRDSTFSGYQPIVDCSIFSLVGEHQALPCVIGHEFLSAERGHYRGYGEIRVGLNFRNSFIASGSETFSEVRFLTLRRAARQ